MAGTDTRESGGVLLCQAVTRETADAQNAALDRVLEHLTVAGINAQLIKRRADRCPITLCATGENLWHPPELIIYANAGWEIATVSVGERSGSYMVELSRVGPDNEPQADRIHVLPADLPKRVALLVARHAEMSELTYGAAAWRRMCRTAADLGCHSANVMCAGDLAEPAGKPATPEITP
ncbi:hypothetical protein AB0J35_49150 [Nonomuraea angiospora]|uniref:hypothetical protein n=1 Tax=Nonomuraea angiospora TaxID=46172 RepID=UPI003429F304